MWTALCSLAAEAVAERATLPSGIFSTKQEKLILTCSILYCYTPIFSHSLSLTFDGIFVQEKCAFPEFYLIAEALGCILGTASLQFVVT